MFWHIPGEPGLNGIVIGRLKDRYHLFTTHTPQDAPGPFDRTVLHAVSDDLVNWSRLPDFLSKGEAGAFDAWTLYDLQVIEHQGMGYCSYTGLDRPHGKGGIGRGQRQAIGLASSTDLITWKRHAARPIVEGEAPHYEQMIPDEACYQEKDRGRQWFRDPWVYRLPTGQFGMAVGARAAGVHPDVNGCFSWAVSEDLIHWRDQPPLYCPRRFHTMECPVIFDLAGRTYLIWLTHPEWGTPIITTDPWQSAGAFYAFSDAGVQGPYRTPADEVLLGGAYTGANGRRRMRNMVARTIVGVSEPQHVSYHLVTSPDAGDSAGDAPAAWKKFAEARNVMPLLKPLRALPNGDLQVGASPALERLLDDPYTPTAAGALGAGWRRASGGGGDGAWIGKQFDRPSVQWLDADFGDGEFAARIAITRGLRAGLVFRAGPNAGTGLQVVLDRNLGCLEWSTLDGASPLDRRRWPARGGWVELRLTAHGPSLEVFCDDKLMLHQVRYREQTGRLGLLVDQAEARFTDVQVRPMKAGVPLLIS